MTSEDLRNYDCTSISNGRLLSDDTVRQTLYAGLEKKFSGQKVLVLIPDHTRTIPLPFLFHELVTAA